MGPLKLEFILETSCSLYGRQMQRLFISRSSRPPPPHTNLSISFFSQVLCFEMHEFFSISPFFFSFPLLLLLFLPPLSSITLLSHKQTRTRFQLTAAPIRTVRSRPRWFCSTVKTVRAPGVFQSPRCAQAPFRPPNRPSSETGSP